MRYFNLFLFLVILFTSSCVSTTRFEEMRGAKDYWESEADQADSLRQELTKLEEDVRQTNKQLEEAYHEQELLEASNMNLSRNYQSILERYEELVGQDSKIYENLSLERQDLSENLATERAILDQRERELRRADDEIRKRETQLNSAGTNVSQFQYELEARDKRISELMGLLEQQGQNMATLRSQMNTDFRNFSSEELNVSNQNGKIRLALSAELLFRKASDKINSNGRSAIRQIAQSINSSPDLIVLVEGHTDTDGTAAYNWNLSTRRATAVVKELIAGGVNPARITASGKGAYHPIATNSTEQGKSQNRRVEIILSPDEAAIWNTVGR